MPPKGGYPEIKFTRLIPKQRFSGLTVMLTGVTAMAAGFVLVNQQNRDRRCFYQTRKLLWYTIVVYLS